MIMIKYFAKKYAVKLINQLIEKINNKVDIEIFRLKILRIMNFLSNLLTYLEDKKIDDEEAEKIIAETKELF